MVYLQNNPESENNHTLYLMALIILAAPFYLNDFANIFVKSWEWWLFIDYAGVKLFPLVVVLWLIRSRRMAPSEFGLSSQPLPSFLSGFFTPSFMSSLNVPGLHLHFLSSDLRHGVHLLECEPEGVRAGIQFIQRLELSLPMTFDYLTLDFSRNVDEDLEKAEK